MAKKVMSPHLSIYASQVSSVFSVFHRIAGSALVAGLVGLMVYALASMTLFTRPEVAFVLAEVYTLIPWGLKAVGFILTFGFVYHALNGVRHLIWDMGFGFQNESVDRSARIVLILSVLIASGALFALNNVLF